MLLNITDLSNQPIHEQILFQLLQQIIDGDLIAGAILSPAGHVAREHRVSKNTIRRAYQLLEGMGAIENINGANYSIRKLDENTFIDLRKKVANSAKKFQIGKEYLDNELQLAREIQSDLLPKELPSLGSFSVSAFSRPSSGIGGDFYDCFKIDEERFSFIIADASGHGLPAALIISQIQAIIKTSIGRTEHIIDLIRILNRHLKENTSAKNFVTLFYGIFNTLSGQFCYANAGHNMPLLIKYNGSIIYLEPTAPALGLTLEFKCNIIDIYLEEQETIVFYTDGITEAMNRDDMEYGEGRLVNLIIRNRKLFPDKMISKIQTDIEQFCEDGILRDDQTMMILKRTGNKNKKDK